LPLYDIKGNWATFYNNQNEGPGDNPVGAQVERKNNIDNNWEIFGNVYADADFLKHFTLRTSFGGTVNNYYAKYYSWGSYQPPFPKSAQIILLQNKRLFKHHGPGQTP
jgi:hypothetical protein